MSNLAYRLMGHGNSFRRTAVARAQVNLLENLYSAVCQRTKLRTLGTARLLAVRAVVGLLCLSWHLACLSAESQSVAESKAAGAAMPPRSLAVLAAAGDQFQYVRRKPPVASRIDPFVRRSATVPGNGLNMMVLRGMDRALSAQYPHAGLTLLTLTPTAEDREVLPQEREAHTMRRATAYLSSLPGRTEWDQIYVVTPKWFFDERKGMGSRLSGIGLFVQPVPSGLDDVDEAVGLQDEVRDIGTGEQKKPRSATYVAPFFYMQVTILDAKTLAIIHREDRYDFRKIINSEAAALDVEQSITPRQLAGEIERFVETAARRMIIDKDGSIDIGPVRTVPVPVR